MDGAGFPACTPLGQAGEPAQQVVGSQGVWPSPNRGAFSQRIAVAEKFSAGDQHEYLGGILTSEDGELYSVRQPSARRLAGTESAEFSVVEGSGRSGPGLVFQEQAGSRRLTWNHGQGLSR